MLIENLRPSSVLDVARFRDFDQFRGATRIVKAHSIPLQTRGFDAAAARIRLSGCNLHLQRTFPRMIDALLESGALIMFPMEQVRPVKMNGVDVEYPALAFARGTAPYRATEWVAQTYAFLEFDAPVNDRGWPEFEDALRLFRMTPETLAALQRRISAMFEFVSANPDDVTALVRVDMSEQLLGALDAAFAESASVGSGRLALARHAKIADAIDARLERDPATPLYSEALAAEFGISVRTLHTVAIRFRGLSLHNYLRMKRLWMVRQQLLSGRPSLNVKACALMYGFWHLGEFSSSYSALFGEVPSQTLARGRMRAA